jgi:hypothetical protein
MSTFCCERYKNIYGFSLAYSSFNQKKKTHFVSDYKLVSKFSGVVDLEGTVCYNAHVADCPSGAVAVCVNQQRHAEKSFAIL